MLKPARRVLLTAGSVLGTFLSLICAASAHGDPTQFPRPAELEPDVQFWERVYSKVSTQGGLLHDDRHLEIVYEELKFPPGLSSKERSALVQTVRAHYDRVLRQLGAGSREDLSDDERRVLALFPNNVADAALTDAADHIRFQLGQSDRFREGLVRSGTWEKHVEDTLRRAGLPGELSALPHVESSFNPRAYSKVGAAGLWQFMRGTGKRWLRVDGTIDERLDPYKSTLAAAQFLNINYSILGTWPLALTAWNHGAGGMRRAKEELGTDDITTIVRTYQGRTFGFASRNFYVSFLAALEVDRNVDRFFGPVERLPHDESRTVRLPALIPAQALERALGTDRETLQALNLALLDPVWSGRRPVPRGFELRVPVGVDPGRLLARLGQAAKEETASERSVTVGRSDTLDRIATQYGLRSRELADYNHVSARDVRPGSVLRIPALPSTTESIAAPADVQPASSIDLAAATASAQGTTAQESALSVFHVVLSGETVSGIARANGLKATDVMRLNGLARPDLVRQGQKLRLRPDEGGVPVMPRLASDRSPADVAPGVGVSRVEDLPLRAVRESSPDPADYAVTRDAVYMQAAETLGHLSRWSGVSQDRLRTLNGLKRGESVVLGRRLKIELVGVDAGGFEARRAAYHRELEAAYFERHRIKGMERIRFQTGETLWTLAHRLTVPVWLLRQYNPDLDFAAVRVGVEVNVPQIEGVNTVGTDAVVKEVTP